MKHVALSTRFLRNLASKVDEEASPAVFDLDRDLYRKMQGYGPYEVSGLRPSYELMTREERLEQQAVEKARAAGRRPNLQLCRCAGTPQGKYAWATARSSAPFGDFSQLCCRTHCVFCCLVLSAITTEAKGLHPSLAAIDEESQGIRLTALTSPGGFRCRGDAHGFH